MVQGSMCCIVQSLHERWYMGLCRLYCCDATRYTCLYVLYRTVLAWEVVHGSLCAVPLWPYKVHVQLRAVQYSPCMRGTVWSLHHRWYIDLGMLYLCDRTRCACLNVLYGTVLEWEVVHGSLYVVLLWHCKVHVPLCAVCTVVAWKVVHGSL